MHFKENSKPWSLGHSQLGLYRNDAALTWKVQLCSVYVFAYVDSVCVLHSLFSSNWTAQQVNAIQNLKELVSEVKAGKTEPKTWAGTLGSCDRQRLFRLWETSADVHVALAQGRAGDGGRDNSGLLVLIMWKKERSAWVVYSWECWQGLSGC